MSRGAWIWIVCSVVVVAIAALGWTTYRAAELNMLKGRLPAGLGVERVVKLSAGPYCGAVIYELDAATADALSKGEFHTDQRGPRWLATPVAANVLEGDNRPPYPRGVACARHLGEGRRQAILHAATRPGALYQLNPEGFFLLVPERGWLVYGFFE